MVEETKAIVDASTQGVLDVESIKAISAGLAIAIGAIGPSFSIGMLASKAMTAIGRNPEADAKIKSSMILAIAFAEAIAIYALVVALIILFV